jgi:hypothetical protein
VLTRSPCSEHSQDNYRRLLFAPYLSAILGLLNIQKTGGLRRQVTEANTARNAAEQLRIARKKELSGREAAAFDAKFADTRLILVRSK